MRTVVPPQFGPEDLNHLLTAALAAPAPRAAAQRPAVPVPPAPQADTAAQAPDAVAQAWAERW